MSESKKQHEEQRALHRKLYEAVKAAHIETEKSRRALKFAGLLFGEDSTTVRDISVSVVESLGAELEAKWAFFGSRRP